MTYASTSIDRRADYYARAAEVIAADPLDFYTRAERGRKFQASRCAPRVAAPSAAGKSLRAVATPALALVPVDPARASRSGVLAA